VNIPRRSFLKQTALVLPFSATAPALSAAPANQPKAPKPESSRAYFNKGTRLTISMWDFSWLLSSHAGGAYEDLERRVAEAAERGYNTLRVDCFPSRILELESAFKKNWDPQVNLPVWTQIAMDFSCSVRQKVTQLAEFCRKHGVWLGLDSWDKAHMFGQGTIFSKPPPDYVIPEAEEQRQFTRYGETWAKALKLMREDGVLERAVWVAPMNEVPHFTGRNIASFTALRKRPLNEGETVLQKGEQENELYRRINHWMGEPIKAEIAREKIPLSYSSIGLEPFASRLTDIYDVVDVHFMPGVIAQGEDQAEFDKLKKGTGWRFDDLEKMDLNAWSRVWDRACRKNYRQMLKRVHDYHQTCLQHLTLPSGKRLVAIITEAFGPVMFPDRPDVSWEWYKRYNADALRVVAGMEFAGSSLSNFAEPLYRLWKDADWHWTGNAFFLAAAA
jgi:hypothetical protein